MKFITDSPKSNFEVLMNFAHAKNGEVYIYDEKGNDVPLAEYVSKHCECGYSADDIMVNGCIDCMECMAGVLNQVAIQAADLRAKFSKVEAENEELRARLEKSVELPFKVGDTFFAVTFALNDGHDETGVLHTAGWQIRENTVTEKNLYQMCHLIQRGNAFTTYEAAETRLKELQGGHGNVDNGG